MMRNARKVQLPKDFAQKLLDCEIQYKLSDTPSKEVVRTLIELYTIGVQYYESIRSHKYLYFQQKMTEIFTTASTITAINDQPASDAESPLKKKLKSNHEEDKIQALQIKQKQEKMLQEVATHTTQAATVTTVKKMINENELKNIEKSQKMKKQIMNQDEKLKQKLERRKSRLLFSKSFSGLMGENDTQDTLFADIVGSQQKISGQCEEKYKIKPIEVSFGNIIKENQSDDDQVEKVKTRRLSISQDPSKKSRQESQQAVKKINNVHN